MGEYPRIASLGLDTEKLCARIDRCANPKESEMTPSENIYRSDRDVVDGVIDVDDYNEMVEDFHEDAYNDDWDHDDYYDDDGQPDLYTEMQDYYGGDDWDHGQFDGEDY